MMSPDGADEMLVTESATPGRQSVGLLAATARVLRGAVATADRYKQFIDADVDTEAAPITALDCDADSHSDEYNDDADEAVLSHQPQPDFQLDDAGHQSMKLPLSHVYVPVTAAATTTTHQPVVQSGTGNVHNKRAVRQRPARPDLSTHTSSANPFSLGKIMPPLSCSAGSTAAANSVSLDVFGAAPFRKKVAVPTESKAESVDNPAELDVFANVPFVRQHEVVAKAASSISPPTTSCTVTAVPNPVLGSDGGAYNTFTPTESYSTSNSYVTSSAVFHHGSTGPVSSSFVQTECVSSGGQTNVINTLSSATQPYGIETKEMSTYTQQDTGPLHASLPLYVPDKTSHMTQSWTAECPDSLSSLCDPVLTSNAVQSQTEEPQITELYYTTGSGSLKKGWLAKLRSEKESPTTAVANLGFSDDPDAILPAATDVSFHESMLDAMAELKSPMMASESNFLLPSGEESHTLPKVGAKKHLSHQHRVPPMPAETDSFSVTKKGIALL